MVDKACLPAHKTIFPFSVFLLLLERSNQFKQLIFNFVVELVELVMFFCCYLVNFYKSYARRMKLTPGIKSNVKLVEIFLEAATTVPFSNASRNATVPTIPLFHYSV